MSAESLIGLTYTDVLHRTITILGQDPVIGPGYYLVERDDGARWGVKAELLERLFPLGIEPKESENASP